MRVYAAGNDGFTINLIENRNTGGIILNINK